MNRTCSVVVANGVSSRVDEWGLESGAASMSIIFDLAVVVAVVWAAIQGWSYWQRRHPLPPNMPPNAHFYEQLKSLSHTSLDYLRGRRGRKGQLLTVALLVGLICVVGLTRSVLVGLIAVGVIAIWTHLRQTPAMAGPTVAVPPPLPPQVQRPAPAVMPLVSEPRKRGGGILSWWLWLILGLVSVALYWEFDSVRNEVHDHLPQVSRWLGDERQYQVTREVSRRRDRAEVLADRIEREAEANAEAMERKAEQLGQGAEEMAERIVDNVEKYVDAATQKMEENIDGVLASPSERKADGKRGRQSGLGDACIGIADSFFSDGGDRARSAAGAVNKSGGTSLDAGDPVGPAGGDGHLGAERELDTEVLRPRHQVQIDAKQTPG